jgi:putative transposase
VEYRHDRGNGHVYQGRYQSFPVQDDGHFLAVARYVERNALRAGLVVRAEDWRFGSLWRRQRGSPQQRSLLSPWPVDPPRLWLKQVNTAETPAELAALQQCTRRGSPFGAPAWVAQTAALLGLESTLRRRGRPRRTPARGTESTP